MKDLRRELSSLQKYKGMKRLLRPPLFNYYNKSYRDIDTVMGDLGDEDESKSEQMKTVIKQFDTRVHE